MRTILLLLGVGFGLALSSCETVHPRKAGGGAYDDSYLSKRLDSNNPNLEDHQNEKGKILPPSYNRWRTE